MGRCRGRDNNSVGMGHLFCLLPCDDPVGTHLFDQRCSKLYWEGRVWEKGKEGPLCRDHLFRGFT